MANKASWSLNLDDLDEADLNALLHEDFALFVQMMYRATKSRDGLVWNTYLDLLCSALQDITHGRRRNLIITMPPRHLKSFCVSVALPAFILGHYPDREIMNISYGQELAKEFARDCLAIMRSPEYREVFGEVLKPGRQTLHALRTLSGGVRRATSLDGTATGVGGHYLFFDDPQKPGEILSDAVRRSTNEAYENTFFSRANDPTTVRRVIVMQRLHEDDFVAHVQSLGGEWEVINLPAIAEDDQHIPYDTMLGPKVYTRRQGEALHPSRLPLTELADIRQTVGEAVWATQYQQRPAPAGGGLVKDVWFKRYEDSELPSRFDRIVQSWDTANTVEQWSDYSVCTTWGVKGRHVYLLHVFRARLIYPDLKRAVLSQAAMHKATAVFIEDHASGTQLIQELRRDGFGLIRAVKPTGDKKTRMVNQTALIENGFVHIPTKAPWLDEYLHELAMFPNGKYADQVDSTSQALLAINTDTNWSGWLQIVREDNDAACAKEERMVRLQAPPGSTMLIDIEGNCHRSDADGVYDIPYEVAKYFFNDNRWKVISMDD